MKIFRKFRWNSITKKGFSKYFFYALGEIVLVVLGILIALYINTKNDIANLEAKQRNHLLLIKEELKNNLAIVEEEEKILVNIITNIRDLINLKNSSTTIENISEADLSGLLFLPITRAVKVKYENTAFEDFIAANSIKDIKNNDLRHLLRSWNRKIETFKFQENVVATSLNKSIDFVEKNGSLKTIFDITDLSRTYLKVKKSTVLVSNKKLLNSKEFENILIQYLGVTTQLYEKNYPVFKTNITAIIKQIEIALSN